MLQCTTCTAVADGQSYFIHLPSVATEKFLWWLVGAFTPKTLATRLLTTSQPSAPMKEKQNSSKYD